MKRPGRRAVIFILLGLVVVAAGILGTLYFMRSALSPVAPPPLPTPVTEKVLITSRGIPLGSLLTPEDLTLKDIPIELVPLSRLTDPVAAIGKITTIPLVAGEMVLPHHLLDTTNVRDRLLAFTLADDQVLMAFPIADLMSGLNLLKRGDLVDIYVSLTQTVAPDTVLAPGSETITQLYTFDAMQRIAITAVVVDYVEGEPPQQPAVLATPGAEVTPQPPPESGRTQSRPVALMLALNPQDALVLKHLKDSGATFDLVLRAPNSTQLFDLTPVTSDYLIDRYGLLPPR